MMVIWFHLMVVLVVYTPVLMDVKFVKKVIAYVVIKVGFLGKKYLSVKKLIVKILIDISYNNLA